MNRYSLMSWMLCLSVMLTFHPAKAQSGVDSFVQGKIRIFLPVRAEETKDGYLKEMAFNDGGTQMFTIKDAHGKSFDVYIDHRLGKQDSWGVAYLDAYPDTEGSVRLIDQAAFKLRVLAPAGIK
jgi:hypothetical protein